jgi:phosphoribosylformimino-5-aminoimidazole carboxamide ribotide isomerase
MILYPAIDLKQGQCVRLIKGDMDKATIYNDSPAAQAIEFEQQGFSWLHVVDLDGAFAGKPVNAQAVRDIRKATRFPIQLGGGIRSLETIETWLEAGVSRVIIGTAAVKNPALVREAAKNFPAQVAVGLDARNGFVATEGWAEASTLTTIEMAKRFEDAGVAAIIFTDIDRDGILSGINWQATLELAQAVNIPVIASGGLASIEDIQTMIQSKYARLNGAITGRALYDGRLDAKEALAMLTANTTY